MSASFPEPTEPADSREVVLVRYLDYFRARVIAKVEALPDAELRTSRVPSQWAPLELVKHLTYVERRWLEWGFEGRDIADPWGDRQGDRWHVGDDESRDGLISALQAQGARSRAVIGRHQLDDRGEPGPRWEGAAPPTLERILLHLVQEYARHLGQLDIIAELATGATGE
jgi:uncharacterized damage-inducible protein DinB